MAVKVVAFDVYHTLADWPPGRVQPVEVQRLLADFGIEISFQAFNAARQGVFLLDAPKRPIAGWTDFLALLFARMDVGVSIDLLTALTAMCESRDEMVLYPDALDAVQAAQAAGLVTCAFTTLPPFMLGLGEAGRLRTLLDPYFDCSAVGVAKGDPRFYRRIIEKLGVEPETILCVGDDPVGDCRLPAEAGWKAVLLDREGVHNDVDVGQAATVTSLSGLGAILCERASD